MGPLNVVGHAHSARLWLPKQSSPRALLSFNEAQFELPTSVSLINETENILYHQELKSPNEYLQREFKRTNVLIYPNKIYCARSAWIRVGRLPFPIYDLVWGD
jgi:hypothetical protein